MNKYTTLLPKMAVTNIRKNGSIYFPYIGVSIFAVFTYFVFDLILKNDIMYTLPKGAYALVLVQIGFALLGIIMVPFLYYTNSFLIKRRKRELGLYSILGLEKKHIGIMMFWESAVIYGIVVAAAVVLGLVVAEPHMSGTVLILVGAAAVLFISGVSLKWFVGLGSIALTALTFIVFATDYMTRKINLWLDPWSEPRDGGYQIIQSLYAIASGGLLGLGLGNSRQKFLYIPEPQNDFLFPIVVEELGLVGGLLVLMLFALLILRGYWLALHARDKFGTLTIAGIITLLAAQVFLNIGVVTGLIPNTGIALPFFSYGGSALAIQLGEMGMVLSISRQIPAPRKD